MKKKKKFDTSLQKIETPNLYVFCENKMFFFLIFYALLASKVFNRLLFVMICSVFLFLYQYLWASVFVLFCFHV